MVMLASMLVRAAGGGMTSVVGVLGDRAKTLDNHAGYGDFVPPRNPSADAGTRLDVGGSTAGATNTCERR
jgi:hypothetical protein